jgi:DNA-directed RNA polymerase specialized sigma24 family protein
MKAELSRKLERQMLDEWAEMRGLRPSAAQREIDSQRAKQNWERIRAVPRDCDEVEALTLAPSDLGIVISKANAAAAAGHAAAQAVDLLALFMHLARLSDGEAEAVGLRGRGLTLSQVGRLQGVTREAVRLRVESAYARIRRAAGRVLPCGSCPI